MIKAKTLAELEEELDVFHSQLNDENEDTPELLAEQLRLLDAVTAAEAADLGALSNKALIAHFTKRAPGEPLAKGLSKAALIAKIEALPPLTAPAPTSEPPAAAEPTPFSVAAYAKAHGLDGREIRQALRATGLKAPYTLEQVEKAVGE